MYEIQAEMDNLVRQINHHNALYHEQNNPEIPDKHFDAMFEKLIDLEKAYPEYASPVSPTLRVGSNLTNKFRKYNHFTPMLSIKSYYSIDDLMKVIPGFPDGQVSVELKADGMGLELRYENHQLKRALTRGNGVTGEDITENAKTIRNIPLTIEQSHATIRGEVVMYEHSMQQYNKLRKKEGKEPYATPRNAAAGAAMSKKSADAAKAPLLFIACSVEMSNSQDEALRCLENQGFYVIPQNSIHLSKLREYLLQNKAYLHTNDIPNDGVVVKINQRTHQLVLGENKRYVKWAWALKPQSDVYTARYAFTEWSFTKTGTITPVVHFKPFVHAGIKYASVKCSWSQIKELELCEQSQLYISVKGNVSAQIIDVVSHAGHPIPIPTTCPCCKTDLFEQRCVNVDCFEKTGTYNVPKSRKVFEPTIPGFTIKQVRAAAVDTTAMVVRRNSKSQKPVILYTSRNQIFKIFRRVGLSIY